MLRGHGPFAIGHLLEEAYQLTSVFEITCKILTIAEGMTAAGEGVPQGQRAVRELVGARRRAGGPDPAAGPRAYQKPKPATTATQDPRGYPFVLA